MKKRLKTLIHKDVVKPGATLKELTTHITDSKKCIIPDNTRAKSSTFVYAMGGVNDVTERVESEDYRYNYREVIFVQDPELCANQVCADIDALSDAIKEKGATPVFATVTKANISNYNDSELELGRTSTLFHSEFYEDMQKKI